MSPTFSSAATSTDGTKVVLTYDEALSATTAATTAFTVRSGGAVNTVNGIAISGSTVELTVASVIKQGQAVHVSYTDPTSNNDNNAVQNAGGTDAATLKTASVNNQSTVAANPSLDFSVQQIGSNKLEGSTKHDQFGHSISTSRDGKILAVGAIEANQSKGYVQVYEQVGNSWQDLGNKIVGDTHKERFGGQISLSADGTRLVVGANRNHHAGNQAGTARIYELNNTRTEWIAISPQLYGSNAKASAGTAVAISGDGNTVAIGMPQHKKRVSTSNPGNVAVYKYNAITEAWALHKINTTDSPGGIDKREKEHFGSSVALSHDGNTIVIGAPKFNNPASSYSSMVEEGRAVIYDFNEGVGYTKVDDIRGQAFHGALVGSSVAISDDGKTVVVGGPDSKSNQTRKEKTGVTYVYERDNNNNYQLIAKPIWGNNFEDRAGAVSISGDGKRVARAVRGHDEHRKSNIGRVEIYEYRGGKHWTLIGSQSGEDKGENAGWGKTTIAISRDGSRVVLASKLNDNIAKNSGLVRVFDINNNGPAILTETVNVSESRPSGFTVKDLKDSNTNTDKDPDDDAISYSITAGNTAGIFSINAASGLISIAAGKALDFETATSHALTVQASDGVIATTATITVNVTNVNDNAPVINNANPTVTENTAAGSTVLNINDAHSATDNDRDGNAITYGITAGNDAGLFSINAATGVIAIAAGKALDFETATTHALTVQASDGTNTDNATITVNVTNVNDNAPVIANASTSIDEDEPAGTNIININDSTTGNDTDADGNAITYSITAGNADGIFSINGASGLITIAGGKSLDYDTASSHSLTILATDGTNTDTAAIQVNVGNTAINAPSLANAAPSIAENAAAGTTIVDINDSNTGNDTDNDGEALTYSINAGNSAGLFSIHAATGVLSIAAGKALDFETATSHTLTVQASDGTNTDNSTITVNVTNINDNAPAIANASTSVAENTNAGSSILNLSDSHTNNDNDRDGNAITYSITNGNSAGLFSIHAATGVLSIAAGKALDFETATSHTVTVEATDGANTDNATITINVTNINDNTPVVADEVVEALETINPGTEIADLQDNLTTNDNDRDGDAITYSITSGNNEGLFAISTATGKITLATGKSLDFDHHDQHILQISATDGTNVDTAQITIDVLDSNTAPSANDDSGTLNENATLSRTAENGIVHSNDTDAQGDSLIISQFQTGSSTNPSAIIGALGVPLDGEYGQFTLQANGSFDYVANRAAANALAAGESVVDTFTYTISDGKLSNTAEIDFTINGINDAPILVDAIRTKKYTEGQSNVTVIDGSLSIRDVDDTNIESATVAITGGFQTTEDRLAFNNNFGITGAWNQGTGILTLTGSTTKANYESALQTVTYTNTDDANPVLGLRTATWTINDGSANSTGITSNIDVGGVNDSPEAFNEAVALNAGSSVSTTAGQANLLANDTDPEGNALNIHTFRLGQEQDSNPDFAAGGTITGLYGQLSIEADGSYTYNANQQAAQRLLTGETRTETFNYTIHDTSNAEDLGEITFTLTGINDKPTATNDTKQLNENSNKFFSNVQGLLINDTDLDGDPLEVTTIRPGQEAGTDVGVKTIGDDVQGTYGSLTLQSDGSYRFNANSTNVDALDAGDIETDVFTYTLSDTQLEDKAEIRINVKGINDAPVLSAVTSGSIADQANSQDLTSSNLTGQLSATDADASASLSYGVSSVNTARSFRNAFHARHAFQARHTAQSKNAMQGNSTTSMSGSYGQLNIDSKTGTYTYTANTAAVDNLAANQTVTETFALFVSDGSLRSTQNFSIQITGANDTSSASDNKQPTTPTKQTTDTPAETSTDSPTDIAPDTPSDVATDTPSDSSPKNARDEQSNTSGLAKDFNGLVELTRHDPITGEFDSTNLPISHYPINISTSDLATVQLQSTEQVPFDVYERGRSGGSGALSTQFLANGLSSFGLDNGVRVMLPDFNHDGWQKNLPKDKCGKIPIFFSLSEPPTQTARLQFSVKGLPISLSTNNLQFTTQNWNQRQVVWAELSGLKPEHRATTMELLINQQLGSNTSNSRTDILTLPLPVESISSDTCMTTTEDKNRPESDAQNLDLELSSVVEEQSPAFLLLKTALSPLILLANMAIHSFQEVSHSQLPPQDDSSSNNHREHQAPTSSTSFNALSPDGHGVDITATMTPRSNLEITHDNSSIQFAAHLWANPDAQFHQVHLGDGW